MITTDLKEEIKDKIFEIQKHRSFIKEELVSLIETNKIKYFNPRVFSNTKLQKKIDKEILKINDSLSKHAITKFKKILSSLDKELEKQLNKE
jgi:hypothetical protein